MLVAALASETASAKGPLEATLEGPGIHSPVAFALRYEAAADDPRRAPLEHLALVTGRFSAVFAGTSLETFDAASRALRLKPPPGDLGPRYALTYRLEGPGGGEEIVQHVYPYAEPRPVLFIAPRSWFVAGAGLRQAFVEAGLPPDPGSSGDDGPWSPGVALAALGAALTAGALALATRRRPRTSGAH